MMMMFLLPPKHLCVLVGFLLLSQLCLGSVSVTVSDDFQQEKTNGARQEGQTTQRHLQQSTPFNVIVLGDGFSSGTGYRRIAGLVANYLPPRGENGCRRSRNNYAAQYADSLSTQYAVTYINRACFASTFNDLDFRRLLSSSFFVTCPRLGFAPDVTFETSGLLRRCNRYIDGQSWRIDDTTDLVFLTMGNGDVGFEDVVSSCLFYPPLTTPQRCEQAIQAAYGKIETMKEEGVRVLTNLYRRMKADGERKPSGKVVIVAYPHIVLDDVSYVLRAPIRGETFTPTPAIRALEDAIEAAQRNITNTVNGDVVHDFVQLYDGTKSLFATHEANPFRMFENRKEGWIVEYGDALYNVEERFYPNSEGWDKIAQALVLEGTFGAVGGAALRKFGDIVYDTSKPENNEPPYAWMGETYTDRVGEIVKYSATGSYDMYGFDMTFEWDLDGNGIFEENTGSQPSILRTYTAPFIGYVTVKVTTADNRFATAKAYVEIF